MRIANSLSMVDVIRQVPELGGAPSQERNLLFFATLQWINYNQFDNEFVQYQFSPGIPRTPEP